MDVIIPDTSAFPDPITDERLDVFEGFDPCAAQGIRGELWTLRAEVERLTAERDAALSRIEKARVILLYRGNGMSDVSIMDRALAALMEVPT